MAVDIEAAKLRAVEAVRTLYTTQHGPADHIAADRNAHDAVTFAVDIAGITHREIAALTGVTGLLVAQLIDTPDAYVDALRLERHAADRYARDVMTAIRASAVRTVREGGRGIESESGFAARAGVDRMAVRGWLGKR